MEQKNTNLLFVDDEAFVIQGLERMLFPMKKEWNLFFANSGMEALELLEHQDIEVIISDMQMPKMDGAELLSQIKEKYPKMIRIILSGHADEDLIARTTLVAHQFLAKPIRSTILKKKLKRALFLREVLNNEHLRQFISGIGKLPSLPQIYTQLEEEIRSDDFSIKKIAEIISQDIGMTAKIIQLVNSAFFGIATNISDLTMAISYLGVDIIKSLVLNINLFNSIQVGHKEKGFLENVIHHSLRVAEIAKTISKHYTKDEKLIERVYLTGILHDIGQIVMLKLENYPDEILDLMKNDMIKLDKAELQIFGASHSEVGAYLLGLWNFPDDIVEAVLYHHRITNLEENDFSISTAIAIANFYAYDNDFQVKELENIDFSVSLQSIIKDIKNNLSENKNE